MKSPNVALEVAEHVEWRAQPAAAAAHADLEAAGEHEIGAPERDAEDEDDRDRRGRLAQPRPREGDVDDLRRPARARRTGARRCTAASRRSRPPSGGARPSARRLQQREERQQAREEEEAVHPAVDAVEQQHPARRGENRRDDRGATPRQPRAEQGEQRKARHGEERRHGPQRAEPAARVRDRPGEDEVQRCAAALVEDGAEHAVERVAADEQRERLVLVGRPGGEAKREERRDGRRARRRRPARTSARRACRAPAPKPFLTLPLRPRQQPIPVA